MAAIQSASVDNPLAQLNLKCQKKILVSLTPFLTWLVDMKKCLQFLFQLWNEPVAAKGDVGVRCVAWFRLYLALSFP